MAGAITILAVKRVRSRAYVSFDVQLGWLTICGSHGDQARCTSNWRDDGVPCELSEAPLAAPPEVRGATVEQRAWVQSPWQQRERVGPLPSARVRLPWAVGGSGNTCRKPLRECSPSFSTVELEFLIRCSFVVARREELRRSRLTKQRQRISREESFLGLDALQLLWNSLEEEEEPAGRKRRSSTFARTFDLRVLLQRSWEGQWVAFGILDVRQGWCGA
eukprot:Skav212506  [mRNA]  locus=scaffold2713:67678:77056:+ [translate_table: standard]